METRYESSPIDAPCVCEFVKPAELGDGIRIKISIVNMNTKFVFRKLLKISETVEDMVAYAKLDDSLFHRILYSTDKNLTESREILERIHKRELYKCIGQTKPVESETFARSVRIYTHSCRIYDRETITFCYA